MKTQKTASSAVTKKVLFFTHNFNYEGAPKVLYSIAKELVKEGQYETVICSPYEGPARKDLESEGIRTVVFAGKPELSNSALLKSEFSYREYLNRFRESLLTEMPDLVFVNVLHNYPIVNISTSLGIPSVWMIHESINPDSYPDIIPFFNRELFSSAFQNASAVIFCSSNSRQLYEQYNTKGNFKVIHNALPPQFQLTNFTNRHKKRARAALNLKPGEIMLLHTGTFADHKNQGLVVRAMKHLTTEKIKLFLVGAQPEDEYVAEIRNLTENENLGDKIFIISKKSDIREYYSAADIFVYPTKNDTYPLVILEAMAFGLPIITTPTMGINEQVRFGSNAVKISADDPLQLAEAISSLCNDSELRKKMGEKSLEVYHSLELYHTMVEAHKEVISSSIDITPVKNKTRRSDNIMVSVCCLTYNHKDYLRKALDGILNQQTSFNFEIIVHDDASTDGTYDIIMEYANLYPDIIRPVFNDKNLFGSGTSLYDIYTQYIFPTARGTYIAVCEGDDYWINPCKLQIQVDFLEQNPDFSVCCHDIGILQEGRVDYNFHRSYNRKITSGRDVFFISDLIKINFIANCSVMYRNILKSFPSGFSDLIIPDWPLHIIYSTYGKIKYFDRIMAIHRVDSAGLWNGKPVEVRYNEISRFYLDLLQFLDAEFYPEILDALAENVAGFPNVKVKDIFNLGYSISKKQLDKTTLELKDAKAKLEIIFSSDSWRMASVLRDITWFFFPPESGIRGYLKRLKQGQQTGIPVQDSSLKKIISKKKCEPWPGDKPLVSIVIPCFNYGIYIEAAVGSVLNQTFGNFEILIVDGGSDDGVTPGILAKINHSKIRTFLRNERHLVGDNRNYGIERANGKYICCLDADDMIESTYIEKALFFLESEGFDVVFPDVVRMDDSSQTWEPENGSFEQMVTSHNSVATTAVFLKNAWEVTGGYKDWPIGAEHVPEDWDFWTRLKGHGYRFKKIPEKLMIYRFHEGSLTDKNTNSLERQLDIIARENRQFYQRKYRNIREMNEIIKLVITNPFINLYQVKTKPRVLLSLPFVIMGGADTVLLRIFSKLSIDYEIIIITSLEAPSEFGDNTNDYRKFTRDIFHLPKFLPSAEQKKRFLHYLIEAKDIDLVFQVGCEFLYHEIPGIKELKPNIKIVDLLFNETGHIANNRLYKKFIDKTITENETVYQILRDQHGEQEDKLICISNGTDTDYFIPYSERESILDKYAVPRNRFIITFLGRFSEEKNPAAMIELAKELNDERCFFILGGQGPEYHRILDLIHFQNLEHSFLVPGIVDSREILSITDVLVVPSLLDGRPNIIMEAFSTGIPVIASNVGGIPGIIQDGICGYLSDPLNIRTISGKIILLQQDSELHSLMKKNARAHAEKNLSDRIMHEKYSLLFRSLLYS